MSNPIQAVWMAVKAVASFVFGDTIKVVATEGFKTLLTTASKAALQQVARAALIMAVSKAVTPSHKIADPGQNTRFSANPYAPRALVFGRTGYAGNPVMATVHGSGNNKNAYLTYIVALSGFGPINAIEALALSGQTQNFTNNVSVGGDWAGKVFHQYKLGDWAQTAITAQGAEAADRALAAWDASHKGSGVAHAMLTYKYDGDKFSGGAPSPIWTLRGSNLCVRPDTLEVGYSEYAPDIVFTLMQGIVDPITGIMVGAGMDPNEEIDRASLSAWRAVCVANNWKVGGVYRVDADNLVDVIKDILANSGARLTDINGKVGVEFDAPGVATYTLTENDLSDFPTENAMVDRKSYYTSGIPRFRSEAAGWELVEAAEVSNAEWIGASSKARVDSADFGWTNTARQARQLEGYSLANMKQATYDFPVRQHCSGLVPGTRLALDFPEFGISEACVKVIANSANPREGGVLRVRVDDLAVHTWVLGLTDNYTPPGSLSQPKVTDVPTPQAADWNVIATTISQGGTQLPVIKATVNIDAPVVSRAEVQIKPNGSASWVDTAVIDRAQSSAEFRGLTPNTSYSVRVRYVAASGAPSAWVDLPAVLTSNFVAGSAANVGWDGVSGKPTNLLTPNYENKNAGFDDYTNPTGVPDYYYDWSGAAANSSRISDGAGGYAYRLHGVAGVNAGVFQNIDNSRLASRYVVLMAKVSPVHDGDLIGAGVHLSNNVTMGANFPFATTPDAYGNAVGGGRAGVSYEFSKLFKFDAVATGTATLYLMNHWTEFGAISSANDIEWHEFGWRYATEAEIQANKALNDPLGTGVTLSAAITNEATTRSNADTANANAIATVSAAFSNAVAVIPTNSPTPKSWTWNDQVAQVAAPDLAQTAIDNGVAHGTGAQAYALKSMIPLNPTRVYEVEGIIQILDGAGQIGVNLNTFNNDETPSPSGGNWSVCSDWATHGPGTYIIRGRYKSNGVFGAIVNNGNTITWSGQQPWQNPSTSAKGRFGLLALNGNSSFKTKPISLKITDVTDVTNAEAQTLILQSAMANVKGELEAKIALTADANGTVTGIEIISVDGSNTPLSKIKFNAAKAEFSGDVLVDGTLTASKIVDNSIGSAKIADNAISQVLTAYTEANLSIANNFNVADPWATNYSPANWTEIQSRQITATGKPILVSFSTSLTGKPQGAVGMLYYLRVKRDGTIIADYGMVWSFYTAAQDAGISSATLVDLPAAGLHTYTVEVGCVPVSNTAPYFSYARKRNITLTELKK